MKKFTSAALALCLASPAFAQDEVAVETRQGPPPIGETVFDGDWVSIGIGAAYSPSYDGSDDYVVSVLPIVQGSFGGVDINPRPGGLALDFIPDTETGPNFDLGVTARIRRNRAGRIEDAVVASLGELETAIEVGPTAGVSFPGLLNPYDSLSFNVDARWDVAGAHDGMVIDPSVTYFTPLSRGAIASLTLGAEYVDDSYADYYFTIDAADSVTSGLPQFSADSGFTKASATILLGFDLDGDATNGGLSLVGIGGYSRMLGDAKRTPFTSLRGDADQFFIAAGIGYTF
uniref:MipA/OmpV family protein n=1 Tax=Parerythrobacter lutipelagi TaxID=1964208 RepID=UPI0010F8C0C5|nr:MipA/OmpV family protein [Parerythrobacter lutipelagi]